MDSVPIKRALQVLFTKRPSVAKPAFEALADLEEDRNYWMREAKRLQVAYDKLADTAESFGDMVLFGDTYGCSTGVNTCLHARARAFLEEIGAVV